MEKNELKGVDYLRTKLAIYKTRVKLRYEHYEMSHNDKSVGIVIPDNIQSKYRAVLGWCAKGVDNLADRIVFREFENDGFDANSIFKANNPDIFTDSAFLSAFIASCSFIYISIDNKDVRLQVIDAANATGIIDPITGLLTEGYAVLERDENQSAILEAYFLPNRTEYYYVDSSKNRVFSHSVNYPLLVPIIHRPDAVRPFGHSRISRSGMYWQKYAKRALERSDVTAEFYSFPQKYVVGTSIDSEPMDNWKATIASMLEFTKDEAGDSPKLGQFNASSMAPFTDQLKTAAAGFAGETGLTLDDLGFVSDNPSSVEAIKASHESLRLSGRKAQRSFGSGLLNVAYLSVCLRDDFPYLREQFANTIPKWEPLFEPDASTLTMIGDGAIKLNTAIPGYITGSLIRDLTGIGDGVTPKVPEVKNGG